MRKEDFDSLKLILLSDELIIDHALLFMNNIDSGPKKITPENFRSVHELNEEDLMRAIIHYKNGTDKGF